jgi:hypothetical protein
VHGGHLAHNKDPWISSFEEQLSTLLPRLTPSAQNMGDAAQSAHGRKEE